MHHRRALEYWEWGGAEELAFCRVTALALLRHLTNPRILGPAALDGGAAWRALVTWLEPPGVRLYGEPAGLDDWLASWSAELDLRDECLPGRFRLVAFDDGFRRYRGVDFLHLRV